MTNLNIIIKILFLCALLGNGLFSQNKTIDSLRSVLKKSVNDSNRVNILNKIAWELKGLNPDTSIILSNQSFQLSKKLLWKKGQAQSQHQLGAFQMRRGDINQAITHYNIAIKLWNELILSTDSVAGKGGMLRSIGNLGLVYIKISDYSNALLYCTKALKIAEALKNYKEVAKNLGNLAIIYLEKSNYPKGLEYTLKCIKAKEDQGDSISVSNEYNILGNIYSAQKEYEKALLSYKKALKIQQFQNNDKLQIAMTIGNIGIIYHDKKNYLEAIDYLKNAIELSEKIGDKNGLCRFYGDIGLTFHEAKQNAEAKLYYNKALKLSEELDYKIGIVTNLGLLGKLIGEQGDFKYAEELLKKSLNIAYSINLLDKVRDNEFFLSKLYEKANKIDLAFEHYKKHIIAKDSLENDENLKKQVRLESDFEWEKKQSEERLGFEAEQVKSQAQLDKKELQRNYFILGFSLLIVLSLFIFKSLRTTQKQKNIITEQKHLVDEKQKEIIDSINYAKRIQHTLLAHNDFLSDNLGDHFVYFNPKDIVSGDFYWASKKDDRFYIAVCDSTGHGVPGAFMSLLNIGFLAEAINEKGIEKPNEVFDFVRNRLTDTISKEGQKDGFDGILVCIDQKNNTVSYSAANNKPILFHNGELTELLADRMPVGVGERKDTFSLYNVDMNRDSVLYLYTDGYADQFGGPKGKKFKYKQLNDLIQTNASKPFAYQKTALETTFSSWRGELEQVDDVCLIGFKIK